MATEFTYYELQRLRRSLRDIMRRDQNVLRPRELLSLSRILARLDRSAAAIEEFFAQQGYC